MRDVMPAMNRTPKWVAMTEAASLVGCTRGWLREKLMKGDFPAKHRRKVGLSNQVNFAELFAWWMEDVRASTAIEQDPDLADVGGSDSPNLERLRKLKGDLAEHDLELKRNNVVPREKWRALLMTFAGYVRNTGDILRRRYGNDAGAVIDSAVDQIEAAIEKELS